MTFTTERLVDLLPAIYRRWDAEVAGGDPEAGPLRALLDVIAGELAVLEEDLAQLYDDQFIETCAEWVAPYIGDLLGYRTLYGLTDKIGSPRAEVANTIAYRRRKGTASMLEQVARDVTGWDARVVEYFQLLAATQYLNHVRPGAGGWAAVGLSAAMAAVGTAFDRVAHTADVRRIARGRGRHNIPNVGLHLWRIRDFELAGSPAVKLLKAASDRRYLFSPLGANAPLFNHPIGEDTISHLATRTDVPAPITRRELWDDLAAFYPGSLAVRFGGLTLPASAVAASDLSDFGGGWAYQANDQVLVDPVLGRLALPKTLTVDGQAVPMKDPVVTFQYGFAAEIGGGPYARVETFDVDLGQPIPIDAAGQALDGAIAAALAGLGPVSGAVEVAGSGRLTESLTISAADGVRLEIRAAEGSRPTLELDSELLVELGDGAEVILNGFLMTGARVRVRATGAKGGKLRLRHCTLVPGLSLTLDGAPAKPNEPSLLVETANVALAIDHAIVGAIRAQEDASVSISDSIVDAIDPTGVAYAAPDGDGPGGELSLDAVTVIGKVHARVMELVSNSILAARLADPDPWPAPVRAVRRQDGCIRYSYVPPGSRTPRRYACQPADDVDATRIQPQFTAERYGEPAYGQLGGACPREIAGGADDESEMGAFHGLFAPQRETNLTVRLDEYLRFGLEAGIFHES